MANMDKGNNPYSTSEYAPPSQLSSSRCNSPPDQSTCGPRYWRHDEDEKQNSKHRIATKSRSRRKRLDIVMKAIPPTCSPHQRRQPAEDEANERGKPRSHTRRWNSIVLRRVVGITSAHGKLMKFDCERRSNFGEQFQQFERRIVVANGQLPSELVTIQPRVGRLFLPLAVERPE